MSNFNIRCGLSTLLFSAPNVVNEKILLEEGYWYLCTDTAELFLCVNENGTLSLKRINEDVSSAISVPTKLSELLNDCGFITEIPENYVVEDDIAGFAYKTDLDGLASETYVNEKVASVKIPEIPSKISELVNDAGYITDIPNTYATKEFVASEIAKAELSDQDVDLSSYYTKSETESAITAATSGKADRSELFSKDYNDLDNTPNIPSIEGLATIKYVDDKAASVDIPTKVSELENDAKFITENGLADYAKKSDIPADYVTETKLEEELNKIEHPTVDLTNYVTRAEIKNFVTEIPAEYITESELESKGYLTEHQSLVGYATEDYVDNAIADINIPEVDADNFVTTEVFNKILGTKANEVPFDVDKFVTVSVGGFTSGESIKGLSMVEILAKLLGLSDATGEPEDPDIPDMPDIPDEPKGIVENIVANELSMYAVDNTGELSEVPYKYFDLTEATAATKPSESGFYQIKDAGGSIIESGYQELQINNDETYYVIALPKELDYNSMVTVKAWNDLEGKWTDTGSRKPALTGDADEVATICEDAGIDISHIDTSVYTIWAVEELPDGSIYRFVINE